jgi:hypothetical protein
MLAAVIVAGKMSADGAGGVMRVGNSLQRGSRRFVARNTVGLGAYGISRGAQYAGKGYNKLDGKMTSTRTGRNVRRFANVATLGLTSDKAIKSGLGAAEKTSYAGSLTAEQVDKERKERSNRRARVVTRETDEEAIKAAEGIDPNDPALTDAQSELLDKREAAINRYSAAELEEMKEEKRNKLVGMLKAGTVSKLLDSDNLSSTEKASLQAQYRKTVEDKVLDANKRVITEELTKLSEKQLDVLGNEFVETYAGSLSDKQMEGIKKSDAFTERQKDSVKATRTDRQKERAKTKIGREALFKGTEAKVVDGKRRAKLKPKAKKPAEIANLPYGTFVDENTNTLHPDAIDYLTVDTLKQMARNANQGNPAPDDGQREELAKLLLSPGAGVSSRVATYLNSTKGKEDFPRT